MTQMQEREEPDGDQRHAESNDDSRAGGDAEAAGSVEERESIAREDDDTWDSES
jgi:hypothetical protein